MTTNEVRDFIFDSKNKESVRKILELFNNYSVFVCLECRAVQLPIDGCALCNTEECRKRRGIELCKK